METVTLLDGEDVHEVNGRRSGGGWDLDADDVERTLGWHLEDEGLCRDEVCIPVDDPRQLDHEGFLNLTALADVLNRPLAQDVDVGVACLGERVEDVSNQLDSMRAPDFTLPDLEGNEHSLSDYRGKKVLLIAHASW